MSQDNLQWAHWLSMCPAQGSFALRLLLKSVYMELSASVLSLERYILTYDTYTVSFLLLVKMSKRQPFSQPVVGNTCIPDSLSRGPPLLNTGLDAHVWGRGQGKRTVTVRGCQMVANAECRVKGADIVVGIRRSDDRVETRRLGRGPAGFPGKAEVENVLCGGTPWPSPWMEKNPGYLQGRNSWMAESMGWLMGMEGVEEGGWHKYCGVFRPLSQQQCGVTGDFRQGVT